MARRWTKEEYDALQQRRGRGDVHAGRWPETGAKGAPGAPPRQRKYRNQTVVVDGERFDSKWEADCWQRLLLRQRAGTIHDLQRQVRVPLHTNGQLVGHYVADFAWQDEFGLHYADAKGVQTQLFRWKAKHLQAEYGIKVEVLERHPT